MEFIQGKVAELLGSRSFASDNYVSNKECCVEEESDLYGFSLISEHENVKMNGNRTRIRLLVKLMDDQNWNNPGAVSLMCRAYQLDNTFESVVFGSALYEVKGTYLTVKADQHLMFADRYYTEGLVLKNKGLVAESVKPFSDALLYNAQHVQTRIERADAYFRLNKKSEAELDYKMVLSIQPSNIIALERLPLLRNNTTFSPPFSATNGPNSSSRLQFVDATNADSGLARTSSAGDINKNRHAKPLVFKNQGLISKLQQSLEGNPAYLDYSSSDAEGHSSSSSSSSSSDSSSDSDSQSSGNVSRKRKHKEHKVHKSKKHKKESSNKKRKSKHKKKDKNNHKKKKKKHKSDK